MNTVIPYGKQAIEQDDIQAVVDVLKSDFLTTGSQIAEFEQTVADYVGAKYAVAISNGTAALHVACFAAGIKPGDDFYIVNSSFVYAPGVPIFHSRDLDRKSVV